jgi:hypothetical protein
MSNMSYNPPENAGQSHIRYTRKIKPEYPHEYPLVHRNNKTAAEETLAPKLLLGRLRQSQ